MATTVPVAAKNATLMSAIRSMFPHPDFPDGPYERTAAAVAEKATGDVRSEAGLTQFLVDLEAEGPFAELDADAALARLRALSTTPGFNFVRGTVIITLYNEPEVWALLGYPGESFSQGGYLERGFDDLDWLPTASVGEMR